MAASILMLSIHPRYARKILGGEKTVELRRVRPGVMQGDLLLLYVTSPVKSLLGEAEVDQVVEGSPQALWASVERQAGVTREEFDTYYAGASRGYAIFFANARTLPQPLTLRRLRQVLSNFRAPQGYRYLTADEVRLLGTGNGREDAE